MQLRNLTMALGALGLVTTPVLAQAADAPAAREGAPVESAEQIGGGSGILVAVLALAAIVGGILIAVDDADEPTSP
jgi:hypothetical protein